MSLNWLWKQEFIQGLSFCQVNRVEDWERDFLFVKDSQCIETHMLCKSLKEVFLFSSTSFFYVSFSFFRFQDFDAIRDIFVHFSLLLLNVRQEFDAVFTESLFDP